MKDFDECITKLNKIIDEFINEYRLLDDMHPFTLDSINDIYKIIQDNNQFSIDDIEVYEKRKNKLDESFNRILKDYYKLEKQRTNELKEKIKTIKSELDENIKNSRINLDSIKKDYEKAEQNTLNDIKFYIDASNQNIDMFEIEYRDSINRFSYQVNVAKASYNTNIDTFNSQLEEQIEKVTKLYNKNIEACDASFNSLVESYNLVIKEKNELIEQKKQEYSNAQITIKNKKREESASLNLLIKEYSDIKNNQINEYKTEYLEAQSKDSIEKEKSNKIIKSENFKANKDFVRSINELDAKIKALRDQFEAYCDEEQKNKYYSIYDLHLEQENTIREFLIDNKDAKIIKNQLKKINKVFYQRVNEENERTNKLLKNAEKEYKTNRRSEVYQKKLLDISRNSQFSKMTERQTRDNKYFQEKSNGYENIFNYNSFVATSEYNKKANKVLLDSSIKNLQIEKEYDEIDAKYQIQIETLTDVIKKYQLEISIATRLNELNHLFLDQKYNREISFLTVTNLLKIEKCKVLDLYNIRQYELNIKNSKNILEYSKNKINLQNERYSALKKQDINISNKELTNIISKTSFQEYSINSTAIFEQELLSKKFILETNINKNTLLNNKFIVELDEYESLLQTYVILYSNIVKTWSEVVDYIFTNIEDVKNKIVKHFFKNLEKIINEGLINLTDTYKNMITNEIANHIKFDNDFKFKDHYDSINEKKKADLNVVNEKKEAQIRYLDQLKQRNDDIRLKLFTLQYETSKDRKAKSERNKNIKLLFMELKNNNKSIDEISKKIYGLEEDAEEVASRYDKKLNFIKSEQDIDNLPYQEFNDKIVKIIDQIKEKTEDEEVEGLKASYKQKIKFINESLISELFTSTTLFSAQYQKNYNISVEKINENYENDIESFKKSYTDNFNKRKEIYDKENQNELNMIKNLILERNNIDKYYNNIIKKNDTDHKKDINLILLEKKESTNQFYTELYAVGDNLKDIELDYKNYLKDQSDNYELTKQNIVDETIEIKNGYNESLKNYIRNRKAIINHLPTAIKENEKELLEDYKKKNKEIEEKLVQSKKDFNVKKRQERKNLAAIEINYNSALVKINSNERIQRIKERKNLNADLAEQN